jgi:ABC-type multidrug transport system fused ATPase/permease subunit
MTHKAHGNSYNRLYDFEHGIFRINDVDVRRYAAEDLHSNTSAVFQEFSQFNASLRENVGVGRIEHMNSDLAIREALIAGGGRRLLDELPDGLESILDDGFSFSFGGSDDRCSLSGGEVRLTPCRLHIVNH